jgi:hypothetical protein
MEFIGHGIGKDFHALPEIYHFANSFPGEYHVSCVALLLVVLCVFLAVVCATSVKQGAARTLRCVCGMKTWICSSHKRVCGCGCVCVRVWVYVVYVGEGRLKKTSGF